MTDEYSEHIPLFKSCGFIPTRGPTGPPHPPPMAPMVAAEGRRSHAMIYIPTHPDDLAYVPSSQSGFYHIVYTHEDLPHTPPEKDPSYDWVHEPGRMLPLIGARRLQRSSCLFLAAPTNTRTPEMYRRVLSVLNNKAVTKIREFFRSIVEPAALELWRNYAMMNDESTEPLQQERQIVPECLICTRTNPVFKIFVPCGHRVCMHCEKTMDRAGSMVCPMCRRLRLVSRFETPGDLFRMTMGLHRRDYTPAYQLSSKYSMPKSISSQSDDEERKAIHCEIRDRFHWETPLSFLESLGEKYDIEDPLVKYIASFAESDRRMRAPLELDDLHLLDPPLSGLTLVPHRLYIALIHYCLDMLTLPRQLEFQRNKRHKREKLALELVLLFLVPTDECSPRGPERIHNFAAWSQHGQLIQARLRKTLYGCARTNASSRGAPPGEIENRSIRREHLYLGVERWVWITQSLEVLLTWIRMAAQADHLQVPPYVYCDATASTPRPRNIIERKRPAEDHLPLEQDYPRFPRMTEPFATAVSNHDTAAAVAGGTANNAISSPAFMSLFSSICQTL